MIVEEIFRKRKRRSSFIVIAALLFLSHILPEGIIMASDKPIIGAEEYVVVMPWGIKIPARVDTGAATTSLDARNLTVKGDMVSFTLPARLGGSTITLPIVDWKYIHTSKTRERRPVVEMELCIASRRLHARVNLNDRSHMKYPMIVGRNVITGNFLVDTSRSYTTLPLDDEGDIFR